ncbi:MAG: PKD domain-containing protein, partial [Bacteroidota bacterium]
LAQFRWDFEDSLSPLQVTFTEVCSYEPENWHWDFGDGTTSSDRYPIHIYDSSGIYQVCLIVSNANGSDTLCKTLYLGVSVVENPLVQTAIEIYPNPFQNVLAVSIGLDLRRPMFRLYDQYGRLIHNEALGLGINEISTAAFQPGVYFWEIVSGGVRVRSGKVVKIEY